MRWQRMQRRIWPWVLLALLIFGVIALYHGIVLRFYTVKSGKLTAGQHFRLAVVTDLHSCIYGDGQSDLIAKIVDSAPDAVLMVGDIYDNNTPPEGVGQLLEGLQELPMFYVTGNHEYWTGDIQGVLAYFRAYGVTILEDAWQEVTWNGVPVVLGGVNDPVKASWDGPYDAIQAMQEAFADLPTDRFSILMAHRPTWMKEYRKFPFDLTVSGHNHGGQLRIPGLLNGLVGPDEGFFPEFPGGAYDVDGRKLIVSRGLSKSWRLPRVFNPPELVIVDVTAA